MRITYVLPHQAPCPLETHSDEILIGRSPTDGRRLDLDLKDDLYVSHVHARLTCEDGAYWVEDLESANGTWVDDEKISRKTPLSADAKIRIGWTRITVHVPEMSDTLPRTDSWRQAIVQGESSSLPPSEMEEIHLDWVSVDAPEPFEFVKAPDMRGAPPGTGGDLDGPPSEKAADPGDQAPGKPQRTATVVSEAITPCPADLSDPVSADLAATVVEEPVPPPEGKDFDGTKTVVSVEPTVITTPPPLPVAPPAEDESRGDVISITEDTANRFSSTRRVSSDDILTLVWRQLKAFNELIAALGSLQTLSELVNLLVTRMPGVIPNAQRGAVLMPDRQDRLLLKAHWPAGEHSVSMTWVQRAFETREAFIWASPDGQRDSRDTPRSALYYQVQSAIYTPLVMDEQVLGVMYVDNYLTHEAFSATDFELLKAIGSHVALFLRDRLLRVEREQEKAMQENLQRQFSPAAAGRVSEKIGRLQLGGERVDPVTILISDVRNFTAMSAKMPPHEVVRMLNEMFDAFVPIIFEYGGTVDKYVGDSVLAVFGSPEPDDRQREKALRAAMEMQQAVRMLGEGRRVRRLPIFSVGISVHSGEAIHGFIGSSQRMEYTVIGDTVNLASRLCDGAGPGEVVISQAVYEHIYRFAEVKSKVIRTKHCDTEPDLDAYVVTRLF